MVALLSFLLEHALSLILSVIFINWLFRSFISWHRLRHFKGPCLAAFSKLWILQRVYRKNLHVEVKRVCEEYGPFVRIGPNDLVTDDLDHVLKISSVRSLYSRSDAYAVTQFDYEINHVFSERDESRHLELRKQLAAGYSGKENTCLEQGLDAQIEALVTLLDSKYTTFGSQLQPLDFSRVAQFFTLDVISEVAFGEPIGFLVNDEDLHGYCRVGEKLLPMFEWAVALPSLNRFMRLPGLRNVAMPSLKDASGVGLMMRYAKQVVEKRFGQDKETRFDMLGSFLAHGISKRQAETEVALQIMAGSDTTVTALRATTLFIISHPKIYEKVQRELDAAVHSGEFDRPVISDAQSLKLTYLQACIRESLRVMPPAHAMLPKIVPPAGDMLQDQFVPGGTRIGTCVMGIVRSKKTFGADADLFRPSRWLEADPRELPRMTKAAEIMFGSGRYHCLGKTVAMLELRKTLATLFERYDISFMDPTRPWNSIAANGLFLQTDMWVKLERRTSS